MKQIRIELPRSCGGITLKDNSAPESGNQCLYLCQDPQSVLENRLNLASETIDLSCWVTARQRHTDRFFKVYAKDRGKGARDAQSAIEGVDALYTTESSVLIGVYTADCIGILLLDDQHPLAAVIHSGWKGTAQAITFKVLEQLKKENLLYPQSLHAWFSPSLLKESLEVGPEVIEEIEAMAAHYHLDLKGCILPGQNDRYFLDSQEINIRMLQAFGIPLENIHPSSIDTAKERDICFSYRNEKPLSGEHFTWGLLLPE